MELKSEAEHASPLGLKRKFEQHIKFSSSELRGNFWGRLPKVEVLKPEFPLPPHHDQTLRTHPTRYSTALKFPEDSEEEEKTPILSEQLRVFILTSVVYVLRTPYILRIGEISWFSLQSNFKLVTQFPLFFSVPVRFISSSLMKEKLTLNEHRE